MSAETIFVIIFSIVLASILFYEIVFVLFYRKGDCSCSLASQVDSENIPVEDIIVQPKPVGYGEVLTGKYEQCKTPVLELEIEVKEEVKENVEHSVVDLNFKDHKKAPTIVVTSPTL